MSKERFDKLMKKQLESVRPAYEPRAWDRFRKQLPAVGLLPWLGQYGGWLLSGLMLTGWLTTLYTLHENRKVLNTISQTLTEKARSEVKDLRSSTAKPNVNVPQRIDTVYIVRRTVVEHRHYYDLASGHTQPVLTEHPVEPDSRTSSVVESVGERTPTDKRARLARAAIQSVDSPLASQLSEPTGKRKSGKRVDKVTQLNSRTPVVTDSDQRTTANDKPAHKFIPVFDRQGLFPDSGSRQTPIGADSVAQQTGVPVQQIPQPVEPVKPKQAAPSTAPPVEQPKEQPAKQSRPPFRLASLQPRVGLDGIIMRNGIGIGPAIEVFPAENIGVSIGLQAAQFSTENHREPNSFNSATGQEFIDQYKAFLPAQYDRIEDISVQTSLISLPVNLKYYVPLRTRWSLVFQTGTRFDLANYQQVRYESYFQGNEQHHTFETNARTPVFHNFMFGAGIQYRKSRITAQLSPYYSYDFRSITSVPGGSNFGLKASLWLGLFN